MATENDKKQDFVPPKTGEEAISRREQFLDSGFEQFSMDEMEKEIFGFVAPKPMTDRQLDKWLEENGIGKNKNS